MAERRRALSTAQLKARLELCREFGVSAFEETDAGVRFSLGPMSAGRALAEPLSEAEANARRAAEFRRVATLHTRGGR